MTFKAPWIPPQTAESALPADGAQRCRFITSLGGAARCQDPAYLLGFCQFHFEAFERCEIDHLGRISDNLDDQNRRRQINYHGLMLSEDAKPVL